MEKNQNNILYIVIIVLLLIIAVLAFFVWMILWWKNPLTVNVWNTWTWVSNSTWTVASEDIELKVISDKRCTTCNTEELLTQLKTLPFMRSAKIEQVDFSDAWVEDILKANEVTKLPAFLFNTNNVSDNDFKSFLTKTPSWLFNLNVWSSYDPFVKRSDRGFMLLDKDLLKSIKENSHTYGNKDAKITWIEYSDLNCGYCAKMHNEWTHDTLFKKYWDKLSWDYQYFAIFNKEGPEVLECMIEQKWEDILYPTVKEAYKQSKTDKAWLVSLVPWIDEKKLDECITGGKYKERIENHMKVWGETFGVTWTPWNIIVNNETWEYEKLPWAYPVSEFEKIIDALLAE